MGIAMAVSSNAFCVCPHLLSAGAVQPSKNVRTFRSCFASKVALLVPPDIEGSPVQQALKSISWSLYRDTSLVPGKHRIAERSWKYLPDPGKTTDIDVANLSFFGSPDKTVRMRLQRTYEVLDALRTLERSKPLSTKVVSGRYTAGLSEVSSAKRVELARELEKHLQED
jgi:hypothetical protein